MADAGGARGDPRRREIHRARPSPSRTAGGRDAGGGRRRTRSSELRDRDHHPDQHEHDDRHLHPDPGWRHDAAQPTAAAVAATVVSARDRRAQARLSCRDGWTPKRVDRTPAAVCSSRWRCGSALLACLAPSGDARRTPVAHAASPSPPGRREHRRRRRRAAGAKPTSAIAQARRCTPRSCAPRCRGRCWSRRDPDQIEPRALAFADRLVSDAAARGHPRDHVRRQHALLGVLGAGGAAERHAGPAAPARPTPGRLANPPPTPRSSPTSPSATARSLAAIEIWNEPDQANQHYFAGPEKPQRYAAHPARRLPGDQAGEPERARARRLARRLQRRVPARAVRGRHQGLLRRAGGALLQPDRSPRCAQIHEVQLANGDTHAAVAGRVRLEQLLAALQDPAGTGVRDRRRSRRRTSPDLFRSLARTPTWRRPSSTSCRAPAREDFGVLNEGGTRKPAFSRARPRRWPRPFGAAQPGHPQPARGRAATSSPAARGPSATTWSSKPSRAACCASGRCSRSTASTATRSRSPRCSARAACGCASTSTGLGPGRDAQKSI